MSQTIAPATVTAADYTARVYKKYGYFFAYVWHPNHGPGDKGYGVSHHPHGSRLAALQEARNWIARPDRPITFQ